MRAPVLSPCAWKSNSRTAKPAASSRRARRTMAKRLPRTPCIRTTAPPPGRPARNHPRSVAPDDDAIATGSAARSGGGSPTTARAGAERNRPAATTAAQRPTIAMRAIEMISRTGDVTTCTDFTAPRDSRRLRPIVALDDDEVGDRVPLPHLDVLLVFGRAVAGERSRVVRKLDHDIARAAGAFRALELATAHQEAAPEFLEDCGVGRHVGLVAFLVMHIDAGNPKTFGHVILVLSLSFPALCRASRRDGRDGPGHDDPVSHRSVAVPAAAISATTASATPRGLFASTIGRPTTRKSAPAAIACAGVAIRFWSPRAASAGRMPGVTRIMSGPTRARSAAASSGEQTRPSTPIVLPRTARSATSCATPTP